MKAFAQHINQTWFRLSFYGALVVFALGLGLYAAFYFVYDAQKLGEMANQALTGTQRQITFNGDVRRRLTPRPTLILRDVILTEPDGKTPAAKVGEMRIGVAWNSLLGKAEIEKLVLNDVAAVLSRNEQGAWNFADLLNQSAGNLPINRALIHNGNLLLQIHNQQIQIQQINYQHEHEGKDVRYHFQAQAKHDAWQKLNLQAQGIAKNENGNLLLPNVLMRFNGQENNQDFSGSLTTRITANPTQIVADNSQLIVRSNRFTSHSDMTVKKITQTGNDWRVQDVNSVFTGNQANQQYSGTMTIGEANWRNQQWHSQEMTLDLDIRDPDVGTSRLALNGSATWQPNQSFTMPDVKISTRQEPTGKVPRLISEFSGSLNVQNTQNWQAQAQGMLDRQPASFSFMRQGDDVSGTVQLAKLNLDNYMTAIQQSAASAYPQWLREGGRARIDVAINTLNLPTLEVNNIKTTLWADKQNMIFEPLHADLYSGHTSGNLVILNQQPVAYTLQQKAENVQILPLMQDLFRSSALSGRGNAELAFSTTGSTRQQLTENLSGSLKLNVADGNWHGLNIAELINNANNGAAKLQSELGVATPFSSFILDSTISKGVSGHSVVAQFTQPNVEMKSDGQTNLFNGQINDNITLISNNGKDKLPIKLSGTIDNPSISLNYGKLTSGLKTAEQKKDAVENALKKQWDWIKESSEKAQIASAPSAPVGNLAPAMQPEKTVAQPVETPVPQKASAEVHQLAPTPKPDLKPEPKQPIKPILQPSANARAEKSDKKQANDKKAATDKKPTVSDKDKKSATPSKPQTAAKEREKPKVAAKPSDDKAKPKPAAKPTPPKPKEKPSAEKPKAANKPVAKPKEKPPAKPAKKDEPKKANR